MPRGRFSYPLASTRAPAIRKMNRDVDVVDEQIENASTAFRRIREPGAPGRRGAPAAEDRGTGESQRAASTSAPRRARKAEGIAAPALTSELCRPSRPRRASGRRCCLERHRLLDEHVLARRRASDATGACRSVGRQILRRRSRGRRERVRHRAYFLTRREIVLSPGPPRLPWTALRSPVSFGLGAADRRDFASGMSFNALRCVLPMNPRPSTPILIAASVTRALEGVRG